MILAGQIAEGRLAISVTTRHRLVAVFRAVLSSRYLHLGLANVVDINSTMNGEMQNVYVVRQECMCPLLNRHLRPALT